MRSFSRITSAGMRKSTGTYLPARAGVCFCHLPGFVVNSRLGRHPGAPTAFMTFSPNTLASRRLHSDRSNRPGAFVVSAPGRVNLIGEHTDYNEGFVLPMAIEKGISIAVRPREDRLVVLKTAAEAGVVTVDLAEPLRSGRRDWACYPLGVLAGFQALGWEIPGFDAEISATLPAGGGLSSSAALEVAMATVVETLCGKSLSLEQKALLCQQAEHEFAGVPCGIMDQFAVTFGKAGHAMLLDCRSRELRYVPFGGGDVSLLVINSGVKHSLADGEYAKRRAQCESAAGLLQVRSLRDVTPAQWLAGKEALPTIERKRAAHVLSENERAVAFVKALEVNDLGTAGRLMYESHESLRVDYEVSCSELDRLVEISRGIAGVHGCRMTGGGFGGCAVALIESARAEEIGVQFYSCYRDSTGIAAGLFVTRAADGPKAQQL